MPNIVLNTNRKSKISASSPRATSSKEHRTISQINELKAAYGADLLGKTNSPGKPRGKTLEQPTNKYEQGYEPRHGLSLKEPPREMLKKMNSADNGSVASSVTAETIEKGKDIRSAYSSSSEVSSPNSPSRKLKKGAALLKVSFNSRPSNESDYDNGAGINIDHHNSTSPETENLNRNRSDPSPDPVVLIPVDDFLRDVATAPKNSSNSEKRQKERKAGNSENHNYQSRSQQQQQQHPQSFADRKDRDIEEKKNLISFSLSDNNMTDPGLQPTGPQDEVFAYLDKDLPHDEIEEEPYFDYADDDHEQSTDQMELMEKYLKEKSQQPHIVVNNAHHYVPSSSSAGISSNPPKKLQIAYPNDVPSQQLTPEEIEEELQEQQPRPTSRKLYLGSDTKNASDSARNTPKVPKSAGARYGTYSPIKGGVDEQISPGTPSQGRSPRAKKNQFKKLSSHGDLTDWIDESANLPDLRPPSRQSTAFPVHLSSDPNSSGNNLKETAMNNTPPIIAPTTVSPPMNKKSEIIQQAKQQPAQQYDDENGSIDFSISRPRPSLAVNTEARSVKKPSTAAKLDDDITEASSSSYYNRPPSRQKVAAQHLFDDNSNLDQATSGGSRRSSRHDTRRSSQDSNDPALINIETISTPTTSSGPRMKTAAGQRPNTTRGNHIQNDDGFAELNAHDPVAPFPITINYGMNGSEPPMKNEYRNANSSGNSVSTGNRMVMEDYEFSYMNSPATTTTSKSRRHGGGGSPRSQQQQQQHQQGFFEAHESSSLRPKSVTTSSSGGGGGVGGNTKGGYYYDPKHEETTLRSKSANHSHGHGHRQYNPVHSDPVPPVNSVAAPPHHHPHLPNKPTKGHPGRAPEGLRTRAWGDQPDPRNIPRAQNVFGLEADTGWTSPAMLNPYSTTSFPDNIIMHDDDDMTILVGSITSCFFAISF